MRQPSFTTAHVISEVLKLRESSALRKEEELFRRNSLDLLTNGSVIEISCPIMEVRREEEFCDLTCRYGLTDAGVIFVAFKMRALVLADDQRPFQAYSVRPVYVIELLEKYPQAD